MRRWRVGRRHPDDRKILVVNPGADLYGSDRMALETVRGFVQRGFDVTVALPEAGPLQPLLEDAGASVVMSGTPILRKSSLGPSGLVRLFAEAVTTLPGAVRMVRRHGSRLVLVNTVTPPLWLLAGRIVGAATATHVHESESRASLPVKLALFAPQLFAQRIIINSEFAKGVLKESAPWLVKRTRVVYNFVPGPDDVVPPRTDLSDGVRLLYVGRLSERKGVHVAIQGLRELRDLGVDATLTVVGAVFRGYEAYEESLHQLTRELELTDVVSFEGFKPSVWQSLAGADIALVPSVLDETFGNTAVEAVLAGRPVVASGHSGLMEACGHSKSAVSVPRDDAGAIARAVKDVVERWGEFRLAALDDSQNVAQVFNAANYVSGMMRQLALDQPVGT